MAKLIDREELLNNRPEYFNPQMEDEIKSARHQGWNNCNSYYYDLIIKQPTVDTERHAHWIIKYDMGEPVGAICSNCESEIGYDRNGYFSETNELYCHNCGCKMDEATNNDG